MAASCPNRGVDPACLGSAEFRADHGVKFAYTAGAMYKAIASEAMVVALARARLLSFFGTGGLSQPRIAQSLDSFHAQLRAGEPFGMNLLHHFREPQVENDLVELFLARGVRCVEAAAFTAITPSVVWFRLSSATRDATGAPVAVQRVLAKVSRPEVARAFLSPAPDAILRDLVAAGRLTPAEAEAGRHLSVASDVCVEGDSGGHTDQGVLGVLVPVILRLRDETHRRFGYAQCVRVGAAGGLGSPEAVAAAFVLGADFVTTGSVNQCTVEAGASDLVKDLLEQIEIQDTAYAPAGDVFESGAKVQVLRKGTFFPGRANKLFELYSRHDALEDIDTETRRQIEERFLRRSFSQVWEETAAYHGRKDPCFSATNLSQKQKMALIFRWYFVQATRAAMDGAEDERTNFQVHCGPALGALNQWLKGTPLASWRNRRVCHLAELLMDGAADVLAHRIASLQDPAQKQICFEGSREERLAQAS